MSQGEILVRDAANGCPAGGTIALTEETRVKHELLISMGIRGGLWRILLQFLHLLVEHAEHMVDRWRIITLASIHGADPFLS